MDTWHFSLTDDDIAKLGIQKSDVLYAFDVLFHIITLSSSDLFRELQEYADQIKSIHHYPEIGLVKILLSGRMN
jgi:hypothetical protein